jgi:acetoacetate decarboxylase
MLYCLEKEEIERVRRTRLLPEFVNAEMLLATYITDANAVKKVLPKPLSPAEVPLASVFVARYPETNFGCVYNEGALFVHCAYKNERGLYCLSMPVDDDMALIYGRERFGYPKKIADRITLEKEDNRVVGKVVRKGEEILRIECELKVQLPAGITNDTWVQTEDWDGTPCNRLILFLFKHFPSPSGTGFDYIPRLIREPVLFRKTGDLFGGPGVVRASSSDVDPLGAIPVKEVTHTLYGTFRNTMLPGKVVGRAWNLLSFVKHAFSRYDFVPTLLKSYNPGSDARAKDIMKMAMRF